MNRTKVIYIAGYGRSGTTLMSIALGNHPKILGAGEISELARNAWAQNAYCSCGAGLQQCEFWNATTNNWLQGDIAAKISDYKKYQIYFENELTIRGVALGVLLGRKFKAYAEKTESLYREIARQSGQDVIVDSSKVPSRAMALARMQGIDLYIVHMVRDGRGVAWSLMKSYKKDMKAGLQRDIVPKSPIRTGLRWSMVNMAAEKLKSAVGGDRYLRVRYEDFVTNPVETMDAIGKLTGLNLSDVGHNLQVGGAVKPQHQLAGNRLRMSSSIKVERDEAWLSQMPSRDQRNFNSLFGWLLRRYGYV
jgi:hypothetical protein